MNRREEVRTWPKQRHGSNQWLTPPIEVNEYRAYTVGTDGHITSSRAFRCADDGEAVTWAEQLQDGRAIEVWSGERFVIRLDNPLK